MLKFLRKYQKWMLSVFCVALMVAFLVPQAAQQFAPQPAKRTMATTGDGEKITREMLMRTSSEIQMMRRLQLDPIVWPGLSLLPTSGNELDDAMQWTLVQRAAARNNLGASEQEAFNLLASIFNVQDIEGLEAEAKKLSANAPYLLGLAKQYLVAEQYRQLVAGIEYTAPTGANTQIGSPGLQRYFASVDARQALERQLQSPEFQQQAMMFGLSQDQLLPTLLEQIRRSPAGVEITGYERVSADQVRYLLQRELTELDLSVVIMDAEDRLATVSATPEDVAALFERFADDAPGAGQPYGLGYRIPNRVKLEALRIPIDALRRKVAQEITAGDVRTYFDENRGLYTDFGVAADGLPEPATLTAVLREEIRVTLTQIRAQQQAVEIAQQARLRLSEDGRGLEEVGPFKKLPNDFTPTPLVELAAEIEQKHGITPEIIQIDEWMSAQAMNQQADFTRAWLRELPGSTVRLPNEQFGFMQDQRVSSAVLGGKAGLFASYAFEVSNPRTGQRVSLGDYTALAEAFIEADSPAAELGLQVGLPGRVLTDLTNSTYVFRLTGADPAHPATELAPIVDQVRKDAQKVKAYEDLVADRETLVKRAAEESIERLMADADAKQTLSGVTRRQGTQAGTAPLAGVRSTAPIIQQAFGLADTLSATADLLALPDADRLFTVELPGDYKLAVVRLDAIRPISRSTFRQTAKDIGVLAAAARIDALPETPAPLSMEALMKATGFKWADGYGPETLSDTDEDEQAPTDG